MNISQLRLRIIKGYSCLIALLILVVCIAYFFSKEKDIIQNKINKIHGEIDQVNAEITKTESQTSEFKKYKNLWPNISQDEKRMSEITVDTINEKLEEYSKKYLISNYEVKKIDVPEDLKSGIFSTKSVVVSYTNIEIEFEAIDDVRAILFVEDLLKSFNGYTIVYKFEIKKIKDYLEEDLKKISLGKSGGNIKGALSFSWYVYNKFTNKESAITKEEKSN